MARLKILYILGSPSDHRTRESDQAGHGFSTLRVFYLLLSQKCAEAIRKQHSCGGAAMKSPEIVEDGIDLSNGPSRVPTAQSSGFNVAATTTHTVTDVPLTVHGVPQHQLSAQSSAGSNGPEKASHSGHDHCQALSPYPMRSSPGRREACAKHTNRLKPALATNTPFAARERCSSRTAHRSSTPAMASTTDTITTCITITAALALYRPLSAPISPATCPKTSRENGSAWTCSST
jgi:hypothetical protein